MVASINGFGWCGTGIARSSARAVQPFLEAVTTIQTRGTRNADVADAIDLKTVDAGVTLSMSLKQGQSYSTAQVKARVQEILEGLGFGDVRVTVNEAPKKPAPQQQRPAEPDFAGPVTMAFKVDPVTGQTIHF